MTTKFAEILRDVPVRVPADYGEPIVIECQALRTSDGNIKVVIGKVCLMFASESVQNLKDLEQSIDFMQGCLVQTIVRLSRFAPILEIHHSDFYHALIPPSLRPFSVAVRPRTVLAKSRERFDALELKFLQQHNLT